MEKKVDKMDACILIDKPQNMTSFDVCHKLRHIAKEKRVGHTGTLDPNATGLMIILLGKYTKYLPYCNHDHKEYIASCKLGIKTDTQDIWGNVIENRTIKTYDQQHWQKILTQFLGKQMQIPPMVSAIKHNGKRLYQLAREGKEVERKPREIEVYELELLAYKDDEFTIRAVVSSGTYIRTLCEDIALASGNLGTLTALRRTKIQNICVDKACTIEQADMHFYDTNIKMIINDDYQQIKVSDEMVADIMNGKRIRLNASTNIVILLHDDKILAAYEKEKENIYKCKRGLF